MYNYYYAFLKAKIIISIAKHVIGFVFVVLHQSFVIENLAFNFHKKLFIFIFKVIFLIRKLCLSLENYAFHRNLKLNLSISFCVS